MRRALLLTTIALSLAGCAALQARDTRRHQVRGRRFRLSTATPRSRKSGCRGRVSPTWACRIKPMNRQDAPTFRRPKVILPVPTPSPTFQYLQAGVPDTQLTREATGLLREFSTPLLFNHSHRVFFWANELGRQTGKSFDAELVFICAAFHDLGLLKQFSSATDRFEVDSAKLFVSFSNIMVCPPRGSRPPGTPLLSTQPPVSPPTSRWRW